MRFCRLISIAGLSIAFVCGGMLEQTGARAEQKPIPGAKPQIFGDWQLRCQNIGTQAEPRRNCEITQSVVGKDQSAPVAQFAIGRATPSEPLLFTVVFPLNVSFPSTPRVVAEDNDPLPLDLPWRRCVPVGCFASAPAKEELLARWRKSNGKGKVAFKSAAGQDVLLPVSFNGLAKALEALAKER
jgi:invasion protein IalB